jgi:hypothetical protein
MSPEVMERLQNDARMAYLLKAKRIVELVPQMEEVTRNSLAVVGIPDADIREVALFGLVCSELTSFPSVKREDYSLIAALIVGVSREVNEAL